MMRLAAKLIPVLLLCGSAIYLYFAGMISFGSLSTPKSGFLPTLAGSMAVLLAVAVCFTQWRQSEAARAPKLYWIKFGFVAIGFIFYLLSLTMLGYFSTTFIVLVYLFKVAETPGWAFPVSLAAGASLLLYILFDYFLAISLP